MRLLHTTTTLNPEFGGPVFGLRSLSIALADLGHSITVSTMDDPQEKWLADWPTEVTAHGPAISHYRFSQRFVPWLRKRTSDFDAVIVEGAWQFSGLGTRLALRGCSVPYFIYCHGALDPYFRRFKLKELKKSLYWWLFEHRVFRDAKAVFFTCEQERERARNRYFPYWVEEATVKYGVRPAPDRSEHLRRIYDSDFAQFRGRRILLFLSRIHPTKGCDILVEAFSRVCTVDRSLHLVIAGPDQVGWRRQLQEQCRSLDIDSRVTFTGPVYEDQKWCLLQHAEAFVVASHNDNFNVAMAEALSAGLPVVITDKVGVWREIDSYGAGVVATDTIGSFTAALKRYLELTELGRKEMRAAAQKCFEDNFESKAAAISLIRALEKFGVRSKGASEAFQCQPERIGI